MKDLLEKNELLKPPQIGKIVEGKIIGKAKSAVFLDLGYLGTGIIYGREFQTARSELRNLKIGDTLFAKIVDLENEEGYIELSLSQASDELAWDLLREKKEKEEILNVKILGANKGGLLAEISGLPAFLPVSQLMPEHYPRVEKGEVSQILRELQKFVGKEMEVKIFDLDPRQGKLILSEKAKENEKIKEILKKYQVGNVVEGEITGITDFGAFVKFLPSEVLTKEGPAPTKTTQNESAFAKASADESFALEGLIHISELDWQLIENPADVVKVGEKVKAKIISIANDKVSLSLKALKDDPWQDIDKKFKKGDAAKGKVTKLNPFGAFVQIEPYSETKSLTGRLAKGGTRQKIQGLCHISEFGSQKKMEETLKIGKTYDFEILFIDPKEHKMSLKLTKNE